MQAVLFSIATVALLSAAPAAAVNLISNGGFETGDFTSWTVVANQGTNVNNNGPHSGTFDSRLRTNNGISKAISQSVATTLGYAYKLTYWLKNNGDVVDDFTVTTGTTVTAFGDRSPFGYALFTQNFVGQSGSTLISFFYNHPQPGAFQLDDVSVTVVPEPAVWVMLVTGFGLVGTAARRRKAAVAA